MAVRILSGVLVTRDAAEGVAVIDFSTNSLAGGTTPGVRVANNHTAGDRMPATGAFLHEPARMIAIRELKIVETEWTRGASHEGQEIERLQINTGRVTHRTLEVRWASTGGSLIEEISYMIIGDV
jgi:hypothetical protein